MGRRVYCGIWGEGVRDEGIEIMLGIVRGLDDEDG